MANSGKTNNSVIEFSRLHDAVVHGNEKSVRSILTQNINVINEKDTNGNTPLLLAICIKDENIYNSIVKILIENNAEVNASNKGFTALFQAVFHQREKSVIMLLEHGAWVGPDERNLHILLHQLVENGSTNILQLILNDNRCKKRDVNIEDHNGISLAYKAVQYGHKDCLKLLIDKGCDLSYAVCDGRETVIDAVFEQVNEPVEFIMDVFDSKVTLGKIDGKNHYFIDFSVLAPENKCEEQIRQMDVISSLLVAASDEEKTEVLQHPIIELFLVLKWSKICHFFYLWLGIYFIFVTSMSIYTTLLIHRIKTDYNYIKITARYITIVTSIGLLGHAILQCVLTHRNCFRKYEMWMNVACTSLSLTVAIGIDSQTRNEADINNMPKWLLNVTSIAILLAWIELMLIIGRLPTYGYYALMFATVLQNVIKVLLAFMCLVIGFALSFSIQFHSYDQFADPWRALVKTTVMMMGEFEYADLFADDATNVQGLPAISRVTFLMFIILTSIVLMNLMVGLAVSDIQGLQKAGHARKLEKQAEFLGQLEKVIGSKQLKSKFIPVWIRRYLARKSFISVKYELKTSGKFRRSKKLSRRLIDSLVTIAKGHHHVAQKLT